LSRTSHAFPIVVSGPSGVGKTTLVDRLLAADPLVRRSVSVTTRTPRPGEVDGRDYLFVTPERFEAMKAGELIEWAEVHGETYGTPRSYIESTLAAGHDVVLNIDIQGGDQVKGSFPGALMVFILPPSLAALEARLQGRGDVSGQVLAVRLANARVELEAASRYEYLIVNDDLGSASAELIAIAAAERARRERKTRDFLKRLEK